MEWANRLLKSPSSRGVKQLNVSSMSSARSATVDNSHNGYNYDRNDVNGCQATSSSTAGNCNRNTTTTTTMTTTCAVEHRTSTSTGAPVRTVSISRSGRYKSKSKQRARLLNSDIDQLSSPSGMASVTNTSHNSSPVHHQLLQQQHIMDMRGTPTASTTPRSPEDLANSTSSVSTRHGDDGRSERAGSLTIGNAASKIPTPADQTPSPSTTPIDEGNNHVTIPYCSAAGDDVIDDMSIGLQVAFESTNL